MKNEFQVVWRESGVDFVKVWLVKLRLSLGGKA
jgi:hypothetical protein